MQKALSYYYHTDWNQSKLSEQSDWSTAKWGFGATYVSKSPYISAKMLQEKHLLIERQMRGYPARN